jgi:ABC transporter substrate binding protein
VVLLFAPVVGAQEAAKVPRIGYLALDLAGNLHLREGFLRGLRDLGYVEGRTILIEDRSAEGRRERVPALAAELVARKVDVIVTSGTPQALAAQHATRTVPIVFAGVSDPVTSGLVTRLARPGGNVTGLSLLAPDLVGKGLEQLKQAVSRGQSGRCRLAARCPRRRHGTGNAEGSRRRSAGAGDAGAIC